MHFDIFAIHPYTTGGPSHEGRVNDVQLGDLGDLQTLLRAADRAGRIKGQFKQTPLWITEFSWDSKPPDPGGLPMKIEMQWTAEALHVAWAVGVDHFFWYSLRDQPHGDPSSGTSVRAFTSEDRRSCRTGRSRCSTVFRFPFVAYPHAAGAPVLGPNPDQQPRQSVDPVLRSGRWHRVWGCRADAAGIFRGRLRTHYGRNKHGKARAVYHGRGAPRFR